MSIRDISKIIRKLEGIPIEEKSRETQALDLFYQGKKTNRSSCQAQFECSKDSNSIKII